MADFHCLRCGTLATVAWRPMHEAYFCDTCDEIWRNKALVKAWRPVVEAAKAHREAGSWDTFKAIGRAVDTLLAAEQEGERNGGNDEPSGD